MLATSDFDGETALCTVELDDTTGAGSRLTAAAAREDASRLTEKRISPFAPRLPIMNPSSTPARNAR